MDELGLRVPRDGGVQKLAEILNYIQSKCLMIWIVPSATSLVDKSDTGDKNTINKEQFQELLTLVNIQHVNLTKIFRNSESIAQIVPAGRTKKYSSQKDSDEMTPTAIDGGECSTIVGSRPTAVVFSRSDAYNYKLYADIIVKYINKHIGDISDNTRIVILCDRYIEPRQLLSQLTSNHQTSECLSKCGGRVKYYDGGVRKFDTDGNPTYDDDTTNVDTGDVESWIHEGGLLLTHDRLFNGCEADLVIFVSAVWGGGNNPNIRSGVTRAVADVCVLMSDSVTTDVEKLTQTFNVEDVRGDGDKVMKSAAAATSLRKESKCNIL